jgi:hypothetical protein
MSNEENDKKKSPNYFLWCGLGCLVLLLLPLIFFLITMGIAIIIYLIPIIIGCLVAYIINWRTQIKNKRNVAIIVVVISLLINVVWAISFSSHKTGSNNTPVTQNELDKSIPAKQQEKVEEVDLTKQAELERQKQEQKQQADEAKAKQEAETKAKKEAEEKAKNVPVEYKSALKQAGSYAKTMHMSKQGVYDQLVSEYGGKFSAEAAQYAIDNVVADWNANAVAQAKNYQDVMSLSPSAIYDQLTSQYGAKFTQEEADYAIQHLND